MVTVTCGRRSDSDGKRQRDRDFSSATGPRSWDTERYAQLRGAARHQGVCVAGAIIAARPTTTARRNSE
jgi:hypothetical protein